MAPGVARQDRYGTRSRLRRVLLIAGSAAVAAVFLGWLLWAAWFQSNPSISSELISWEIRDDHTALATLHIARSSEDVTGVCVIRALAADHSVVGELQVDVPGADGDTVGTVQLQIRTERRASAVEKVGCTTEGQPRPR